MRDYLLKHEGETRLFIVLALLVLGLGVAAPSFLSAGNIASLLNNNAVNVIWAVGLLVVLIAGGIDISFAVGASVVQYLTAIALGKLGGGNWMLGLVLAGSIGIALGCINAAFVAGFRIISIVVTIATFNAFFGLLMFATSGKSIYDLPDWWTDRVAVASLGDGGALTLPVAAMVACMAATWFLIDRTTIGRQLYAFGDNPDGARRAGVPTVTMQFIAYGWMGLMAGIGGLMQVNLAQEVVPNALIGRELDVLAAVVLGGARLGGGRGSVLGCLLGVLLVAVVQNGLNLLGVSPYAFKMVIGLTILVAISFSNVDLFARLLGRAGEAR
ncbi:ABC transporter permease [Bradyrhizobium sp. HKCCYLR20261]|uniref:ABC transporter permease n=1 Tax=unclassified Bradyrhizobium TaxID=2631580 RepID=UPI003EBBCA87